jgi:predicted kinase
VLYHVRSLLYSGLIQFALIARFLIWREDMGFTNNNNRRPLLITFCGLPGSGKTTIAKELEKTTGAVRLNTDEWVAALGVDFWDDAFREKLQVRLYEHGITLLQRGQSIILEDGHWRRDERDRHREVAHKLGAAIEIHYFDLPFDELWRRLEARNASGAYDTVPITKELLNECWRKFQRLDEAELALFDSSVVYT